MAFQQSKIVNKFSWTSTVKFHGQNSQKLIFIVKFQIFHELKIGFSASPCNADLDCPPHKKKVEDTPPRCAHTFGTDMDLLWVQMNFKWCLAFLGSSVRSYLFVNLLVAYTAS